MFCVQIFANKGLVLFEHPAYATSWENVWVRKIVDLPGVIRYEGDQCPFQDQPMLGKNGESGFAKKTLGGLPIVLRSGRD